MWCNLEHSELKVSLLHAGSTYYCLISCGHFKDIVQRNWQLRPQSKNWMVVLDFSAIGRCCVLGEGGRVQDTYVLGMNDTKATLGNTSYVDCRVYENQLDWGDQVLPAILLWRPVAPSPPLNPPQFLFHWLSIKLLILWWLEICRMINRRLWFCGLVPLVESEFLWASVCWQQ